MTSSLISSRKAPAKATEQNAKASPQFAAKLAETQALLQRAAADFTPVTQASSLGAEDVVITHLINSLKLDIPVFVLETGALHTETLALLERTEATSRAPIHVYRPVHESVIQFVRHQGQDAMYKSIELRKECCGIRKMEPLARMMASRSAWVTGLRREQSNTRAVVPFSEDDGQEITNLAFSPDGEVLVFVRGGDHDANWPAEGGLAQGVFWGLFTVHHARSPFTFTTH